MKPSWQAALRRPLSSMLVAAGLAAALSSSSCAPAVDTAAIAQELTRIDDEWSKVATTRDADAVGAYYAEDAIAYPPGEPAATGRAAATAVWAAYFADSTFTLSWKTVHAGASKGGDFGYTAGTYEDSFMGPDSTRVHETGKYVCLWAKQADGSWKAVHDIWNADAR